MRPVRALPPSARRFQLWQAGLDECARLRAAKAVRG